MGFGLLFVFLVVGAIVYAGGWHPQFTQWSPAGNLAARNGSNNALEILWQRYARGEISREQYQHLSDELSR